MACNAAEKRMPTKKSTDKKVTTLPAGADEHVELAPIKPRRGRPVGSVKKPPTVVHEPHIAASGKLTVKYLNNADMLKAVLDSKAQGAMSDTLARMLMLLVRRYASKGNFVNYTYNDEMQSFALQSLCKTWASFDPEKSSNCFGYYTQCTKNSFIQYLGIEKKQQRIRDKLMIAEGLLPSFSYQLDHASEHHNDYSGEYDDSVRDIPTGAGGGGYSSKSLDKHFDAVDSTDVDEEDHTDGTPDDVGIKPRHELDDFIDQTYVDPEE